MHALRPLLVFVVLTMAAACGGAGDKTSQATVLNRGLGSDPETLDAHKARSLQSAKVLRDLGEGLLSFTASGELTAGVAERWEVSEDGLTYTFHLRPDARWSNGDSVSADQFVFGFDRLVDPDTAAFYAQFVSDIDALEALGERTLVMRLTRPTPYLLSLLTHPATFPMHEATLAEHGDNFARPGTLVFLYLPHSLQNNCQ